MVIEHYKAVLENSVGLPGEFFTSNDVLRSEFTQLMSKSWVCIGLDSDVSEVGSVRASSFADQPIVMTRAEDGKVRAFHNICRHRGAILCRNSKKTKRARLTCPYHAWSYALDGSLLKTPHIGGQSKHTCESVDTTSLDLLEIRTELWGPFVFANLDGNAAGLEEYVAPMRSRFKFLDLDLLRTGPDYNFAFDVKANWKLAVENYVESYHVPMVHPELQRVNPMGVHFQILGGDEYVGLGGRADGVAGKFDPPLPTFPKAEDEVEYEALYVFPNIMITCLPNMLKVIILEPHAPDHVRERLVVFFVGDEAMQPQYSEARATAMKDWSVNVNFQDQGIVEEMQQGRLSAAFDGGRFAPKQESTSLHFQKIIAKRMLAELEPSYTPAGMLPVENIHHDQA